MAAVGVREAMRDDGRSAKAIQERGRWASDIWQIYQRSLLVDQLDASRVMGSAAGVDMEAVCLGWSQPSRR